MQNIEVIMMRPTDIKPYENNPRLNDLAVDKVAESIKAFGFRNPIIVDKDGVIIAGHTRWKASIKLGLEQVPVIVAKDMTEEQVKAFRIADNKTGEFAEWDYEKLLAEIEDLKLADFDTELTGFSDVEIAEFIGTDELFEVADIDEDELVIETAETNEGKRHKIHKLSFGKHETLLTREEFARLEKLFKDYINRYGNDLGFVSWLLDGRF